MQPLIAIFFVTLVALAAHLAAMSFAALGSGVVIREASFGVSKTLFRFARFRLALLPIATYIKVKDSRVESLAPNNLDGAFDRAGTVTQLFISLSGCLALLALAYLALGSSATRAFLSGFQNIIYGALFPMSEAQRLISAGTTFAQANSFFSLLGLVAAKLAAINLMPFPGSNGSTALAVCLRAAGVNR